MISQRILQQLLNQVPMMVADLGCIVSAAILWRRAPLSSFFVMLACGATLVLLVGYPFAYTTVVHWLPRDTQTVSTINAVFGTAWAVVGGISTTLLVLAVYTGRKAL
jgi:hypothetical protein